MTILNIFYPDILYTLYWYHTSYIPNIPIVYSSIRWSLCRSRIYILYIYIYCICIYLCSISISYIHSADTIYILWRYHYTLWWSIVTLMRMTLILYIDSAYTQLIRFLPYILYTDIVYSLYRYRIDRIQKYPRYYNNIHMP